MATQTIILDLMDIERLLIGGEVPCKVKDQNIILTAERDVPEKVRDVYTGIASLENGHRVVVDGREYVDKRVFQEHLNEQIMYLIGENNENIH